MSVAHTAASSAASPVPADETFFLRDDRDIPIFIHSELDDLPLSSSAFRVYGHLARRAGRGVAWPSYASIGEACFRADKPEAQTATLRRIAIEAVKELCWFRLIVRVHRAADDGGLTSNGYVITDRASWLRHAAPYISAQRAGAVIDPFEPAAVVGGGGGGAIAPGGGGALHQGGAIAPKGSPDKGSPAFLSPAGGGDVVQALFDLAPVNMPPEPEPIQPTPTPGAKMPTRRGRVTQPVVGVHGVPYDPRTGLVKRGAGTCVESVFHEFRPVKGSGAEHEINLGAPRVDDWTAMVGANLDAWRAVCWSIFDVYTATRRMDIFADWFQHGIPDDMPHSELHPRAKEAASGSAKQQRAGTATGTKPSAGARYDAATVDDETALALAAIRGEISREEHDARLAVLQGRAAA